MWMLIGLIVVVLVMGFVAFLIWMPQLAAKFEARERAQRKVAIDRSLHEYLNAEKERAEETPDGTPDDEELFAPWWFAVRSDSSERVLDALGMDGPVPCNWQSASVLVSNSFNTQTFVSPPVHGWVLISGGLPDPGEDWEAGQSAETYLPTF